MSILPAKLPSLKRVRSALTSRRGECLTAPVLERLRSGAARHGGGHVYQSGSGRDLRHASLAYASLPIQERARSISPSSFFGNVSF